MKKIKRTYTESDIKNKKGLQEKNIVLGGKETRYSVRSDGTVFSNNYRNSGKRHKLALHIDTHGYVGVHLAVDGKSYIWLVHQLVAEAFIPNKHKKKKPEVNHKDGNKKNNKISNLEWCSRKYNIKHSVDHNLIVYKSCEKHHNAKIKNKDVHIVCGLLQDDFSIKEISKQTGISYDTVSGILYKKEWVDVSDEYDFSKRSNHHSKKITEEQAHEICRLYAYTDMTMTEISKKFNIHKSTVSLIIRGKNWGHVSSMYKFKR